MRDCEKLLFDRPIAFGEGAGYYDLREFHNDWIRNWIRELQKPNNEITHQAHRNSYKSTCEEILAAILLVVRPDLTIGLFRKTQDSVVKTTRGILKILQTPLFATCAMQYWNGIPQKIRVKSQTEIDTNYNSVGGGQSQFTAQGIHGTLTSQHFDIIITDDIITKEDRGSRAERDFTRGAYLELQRLLNDGGAMLNTGTPWHKQDAFELMPMPETWDYHRTGLLSQEKIAHLQEITPASEFSANYELKHIADEDAMFSLVERGDISQFPMDGCVMYIDPAFTPTGHDYTAICCMSYDNNKANALGFAYRTPWNRLANPMGDVQADIEGSEIAKIIAMCNVKRIAVEVNSLGELPMAILSQFGLPIIEVNHNIIGKHQRIMTTATIINDLRLIEIPGNRANYEFVSQVYDYNMDAEFRDAPDALAGSIEVGLPELYARSGLKKI